MVNIGDYSRLPATQPRPPTALVRELTKAGVSEDMIRLSVGIEHINDLLAIWFRRSGPLKAAKARGLRLSRE